jgi:hypothetical protein
MAMPPIFPTLDPRSSDTDIGALQVFQVGVVEPKPELETACTHETPERLEAGQDRTALVTA